MINQTSASTSSYPFSTRSFASLSLDLIVGSIRRSECGPARLHFLLHSSYWVPPAALPFRELRGYYRVALARAGRPAIFLAICKPETNPNPRLPTSEPPDSHQP